MSKQLYGIFAKAKKPHEDTFDRGIAPTIRRDKYKRLVDISSLGLRVAIEELQAHLDDGESLPGDSTLSKEHEGRVEMIAKGQELVDSSTKLLERWSERSKEDDDSANKVAELPQSYDWGSISHRQIGDPLKCAKIRQLPSWMDLHAFSLICQQSALV